MKDLIKRLEAEKKEVRRCSITGFTETPKDLNNIMHNKAIDKCIEIIKRGGFVLDEREIKGVIHSFEMPNNRSRWGGYGSCLARAISQQKDLVLKWKPNDSTNS